ncbi:alpha/beta hydrolase [Geodermatophilus sp. URMC 60]
MTGLLLSCGGSLSRPDGAGPAAAASPAAPPLEQDAHASGAVLDVHRPDGSRATTPTPVVVLLHGCCGDRADLTKLAEALARAGALVFNADWAGIDADARFPDAYEEAACAVRFARERASGLGGDPHRVILAGWSDGALVATVLAVAGDTFDPARCRYHAASAVPDAVVGIAGFYGWPVPVPDAYVTPRAERFFGGPPDALPQSWTWATPYAWLDGVPTLPAVLLAGIEDPLVDDARRYADELTRHGRPVRLVEVPAAGDQTLISPRTREGRIVVAEVLAAAGPPRLGNPADPSIVGTSPADPNETSGSIREAVPHG